MIHLFLKTTLIFAIVLSRTSQVSASDEFGHVISIATKFRAGDGRQRMEDILGEVHQSLATADSEQIARLVDASMTPELPLEFAARLFEESLDHCDAESFPALISAVLAKSARFSESELNRRDLIDHQAEYSSIAFAMSTLILRMENEPMLTWAGQTPSSLTLVSHSALGNTPVVTSQAQHAAVDVLVALDVDAATKSETALNIISSRMNLTSVDHRLLSLLDERARDSLVAIVNQSLSEDLQSLPIAPIYALAHLGDTRLLELLQRIDVEAKRISEQNASASRKIRDIPKTVPHWRAMVLSQESEASLLEFIKTFSESEAYWLHRWSINRAIELGIDSRKIRESILAFERSHRHMMIGDDLANIKHQMHMVSIKALAQDAGILRANDMGHVKVPEARKFIEH
jgi:hypothetical protein